VNWLIAPGINPTGLFVSGAGAMAFFSGAFWAFDRPGFQEMVATLKNLRH
jgi:hypothetical protein